MEKYTVSLDDIKSIEDLIKDGATVPIFISGNSMNPFLISRRDIVWLSSCKDVELKKGDVVLFKRPDGSVILHRIKSVLTQETLKVNGDAQSFCELVKRRDVKAVVSAIERKGKKRPADAFYFRAINAVWQALMPLRPFIMRVWFKLMRMKSDK